MVVHAHYPLGEPRVERQALALIAHGYDVDVICLRSREESARDSQDGVYIHRLPVQRHKKSGALVQFLEYLAFFSLAFVQLTTLHFRRRYCVVQVHNLPDFLVFAALVPKLSGARIILDLHDLMPEFFIARFGAQPNSWPEQMVRWQERISCRFADHIVTVTEPWRQTLIERGLAPEKVSVLMNVADSQVFYRIGTPRHRARDDSHLDLIYHGNLTQRYGVDLIIQAVDMVRRQIPQVHLTIHGRGEFLETLVELAEALDLGRHVRFSTGYVRMAELSQFLRKADVGIVPYRRDTFTDGILPTKLMEYVALGLPVIAARTPTIAAYFDETMVEFFEPDDPSDLASCILALHEDRERLAQLAENGQKFTNRHNWTEIRSAYVSLVDRLGA
jgi:glycosyltransferase involved in cell wall biosynthesis